jgi:hypothetical protein
MNHDGDAPKPQPGPECESLLAAFLKYARDRFTRDVSELLSLGVPLKDFVDMLSKASMGQEAWEAETGPRPSRESWARYEGLLEDLMDYAQSNQIDAAKTLKEHCQFSNATILELVERNLLTQEEWDQQHGKATPALQALEETKRPPSRVKLPYTDRYVDGEEAS